MAQFGDFQAEIYLQGMTGGSPPALPMAFEDLQAAAQATLAAPAYDYVAGGAGAERTMRANREALDRWAIVPRMLRGVPARSLDVEVCGTALPAPVLLAPVGVLGIIHPDGDREVARAAAATGVGLVVSTAASSTLEDVAAELGATPGWFQLYWPRDREVAASLLRRAEAAGYRAIVVTVDTWALAWRPRDLAHGHLPFLTGQGLANYFADPAFRAALARPPEEDRPAAVLHWAGLFGDPELTFDDLAWLRGQTDLPVLVKGICRADDARAAVDAGADGLVVSNHGGRQVDGAIGALDCLPDVVAAAGGRPVLFDSGVRTGADVVKALALGAKAVLLGRPYVYGLALAGADGVRHVLRCLLADLDLTLALSGHRSPAELSTDLLARTGR